ncbi:MAG: hypothetical protein OYK82_01880 [Gammaproteobacteria bacterium]|nr:hypothetical protein [Gammaproteobacteria bacterium]
MTVDQYFALVPNAAALITAVAALATVVIMACQLRAAYRPELALSRAMIRSTRVNGEILPRLWITSAEFGPDYVPSSMYGLCVEVRNIGLGTAKDVRMKWSYQIEEFVKEVNDIAGNERVLRYNLESERLNVRLDDRLVQSVSRGAHRKESIDYIMPASIEPTSTKVMVPLAYQSAASAMVFFCGTTKEMQNVPSLPPLKLEIRYKDIGQREHSVSFDVYCRIGGWNSDGEIILGFLEYRRLHKLEEAYRRMDRFERLWRRMVG